MSWLGTVGSLVRQGTQLFRRVSAVGMSHACRTRAGWMAHGTMIREGEHVRRGSRGLRMIGSLRGSRHRSTNDLWSRARVTRALAMHAILLIHGHSGTMSSSIATGCAPTRREKETEWEREGDTRSHRGTSQTHWAWYRRGCGWGWGEGLDERGSEGERGTGALGRCGGGGRRSRLGGNDIVPLPRRFGGKHFASAPPR